MILTLTGMAVLYSNTAWAPVVMGWIGGPKVAALIHRTCAVIFATVFIVQLIYFALRIGRNWRTFQWFGPNSLVPRWQDLWDMIAMFKWFFALGPRPVFDRWTYWEKFDYWAPFWGVTIIGVSGVMLWFPAATGSFLPGWVFNVATIFHGEEALLAALFLFTVHFFNNHFRPDKFPLDVVMFTGTVPLQEFKHDTRWNTTAWSRPASSRNTSWMSRRGRWRWAPRSWIHPDQFRLDPPGARIDRIPDQHGGVTKLLCKRLGIYLLGRSFSKEA